MRDLLRHSVAMLRNPRLVLLHLVGNAVLLVAASFWLLIPEEHIWQLLFAGISALLIVLAFLWIHSGTLAYAAEPVPEKLKAALSPKVSRLLWLLLGLSVLLWCMSIVDGWSDSDYQISGYLYSKLPSWMHPTSGDFVYVHSLDTLFSILYWYVLPCLFLPVIAARIAGSGTLRGLRTLGRWQYWLAMAVTALLGAWATRLILAWTPGHTLHEQTAGLVVRLALAYGIATAAWLLTAGLLGHFAGSGNPVESVPWNGLWKRLVPPGGQAHSIIQHCLAVARDRRLIALQLIAVIVVAAASRVNTDTLVDLERVGRIIGAIALGLLLLITFLWAYSGTLAYAAEPVPAKFRNAFRFSLRRMAWLFAGVAALILLTSGSESLLWMLNKNDLHFGLILRVTAVTSNYLLPCLLLPWVAAKVMGRRLRDGLEPLRSWQYWTGMAIITFLAGWLSDELGVGYPGHPSFWNEAIKTIHIGLGSLPIIVGCVLAAGLVGYFVSTRNDGTPANLVRQTAS